MTFISKAEYHKAWRKGYRIREPVVFETTEKGCLVPINRKLNDDGYYRVNQDGYLEMYHRKVWKENKGPIPLGYEINHKCNNRACSNLEHLECIPGDVHTSLTNRERYKERAEKIKQEYTNGNTSVKELANKFSVSKETIYRHLKQIKE